MSKDNLSLYDAFVLAFTDRFKENRSLVNRLNWVQRHFGDVLAKIDVILEDAVSDKDKRLNAASWVHIIKYLLHFDRISLWNPLEGDDREIGLLSKHQNVKAEEYIRTRGDDSSDISYHDLCDFEYLRVGEIENYQNNRGGISVFRLALIAYNVASRFMQDQGIAHVGKKTQKEIRNGEFDDVFVRLAQNYHNERTKSKAKKDVEKTEEVPTLEQFINGDLKPSEMETEILNEIYPEVSKGKKAQITKELNKRED